MLTNEQIAEAITRPTAIEELHSALRRQIDDDILAQPAATIQSIFDQHALAARRVSRATFYRYARRLRLLQAAADLDQLLGPDGPPRAKLFAGIQNGLLYQLAETVNAEEIDAGLIQKLTQSLKSLVTTDITLQKYALRSNAPVRTPSASAGRENQPQPAISDVSPNASDPAVRARGVSPGKVLPIPRAIPNESPSTHSASPVPEPVEGPSSDPKIPSNPYHLPDYLTTEQVPLEKLNPKNWDPIAKACYEELWEFQKKMCIEQKLIPEECADLPPPDPATILSMPTFPDGYFGQPEIRTPSASAGREDQPQPAMPDVSPNASAQEIRARGVSPGTVSPNPRAIPNETPSTQCASPLRASPLDTPHSRPRYYTLRQVPHGLKPKLKKLEDYESPWARLSDGTPMTHAEFVVEFREICYHRHPGLFMEPTDDEKAELKKNPQHWLWSADPMKRAHPYGRKPDKSVRSHDEFQFEVDARVTPTDNQIAQPPSRILFGPRPTPEPVRAPSASAGRENALQPTAPDEPPATRSESDVASRASKFAVPPNPENIKMIICRTRPFRPSTSCRARRCDTHSSDTT